MLLEVWIISVFIASIFLVLYYGNVSKRLIIRSILPNTFGNNGYITLYLLFYPIHVCLNRLINLLGKRTHFRIAASMFALYYVINFIHGGTFFASGLIYWVTIYLIVAYIKKYLPNYVANTKKNIEISIASIILFFALVYLTNIIGLRVDIFKNKPTHWASTSNPFLLISSISLLCLAINSKMTSKSINYVSSLSMLIYIIHENIFIRLYTRPQILEYIYIQYGYNNIVLIVLLLAIFIFVISTFTSIMYKLILERPIRWLTDKIYNQFNRWYGKIESRIINS